MSSKLPVSRRESQPGGELGFTLSGQATTQENNWSRFERIHSSQALHLPSSVASALQVQTKAEEEA